MFDDEDDLGGDEGDDFASAFVDLSGEGDSSNDDLDLGDIPDETGGEEQEAETSESGEEQPAAAAGQQPVQPIVQPQAVQTPTPGQQQGQQSGVQPQQPQQPASLEAYVQQNSEQIIGELAKGPFKLTDAEAEALGDAGKIVPAMLAKAHLISTVQTHRALSQALPQAVMQIVQTVMQSRNTEEAFFTQYPELKTVDRGALAQLANMANAQRPQGMTDAQFMEKLAHTASAFFGVAMQPKRGKSAPFQPAGGAQVNGGSPRPPATRKPVNTGNTGLAGFNEFLRDSAD